MIVLGEFAHSGKFNSLLPLKTGKAEAGSVLSFAASVYGFATGWCSYAADYTVYQPVGTSRKKVFAYTFAGLFVPLCFSELLGAAVATAAVEDEAFSTAYFESGIGGLFSAVLIPPLGNFGRFCLVVLALSIIGECPSWKSYTAAKSTCPYHLDLQLFCPSHVLIVRKPSTVPTSTRCLSPYKSSPGRRSACRGSSGSLLELASTLRLRFRGKHRNRLVNAHFQRELHC